VSIRRLDRTQPHYTTDSHFNGLLRARLAQTREHVPETDSGLWLGISNRSKQLSKWRKFPAITPRATVILPSGGFRLTMNSIPNLLRADSRAYRDDTAFGPQPACRMAPKYLPGFGRYTPQARDLVMEPWSASGSCAAGLL
jgi:hypothetical protein